MHRGIVSVVLVLAASTFCAGGASAQDFPTKLVRIVAPMGAGGSTDVLTRIIGQKLGERWGQIVLVENRVGASGNLGSEMVARAAPDGYTLLMGSATNAINMSLFRDLRYDLAKDLTPIAPVATFPLLLLVHPSVPVKTVKELIALAKARPNDFNFGSAGNGSPNHLCLELFKTMGKVSMTHIPYKGGSGQVVNDLLAGQIQLASMGLPPSIPFVKAGRLRAIAITSASRSPFLPDVPTVSEAGLPGFEVSSWFGLFGPAGLPRPIVTKVNRDVVAALAEPDVKDRLGTLGAEPMSMSVEEFTRFVQNDIGKWAKIVKASGATAD
jgi:tripartite-type tricarboxylate transporter receptor subunit TctC